jgi:hypothetical protein
MAVVFPPPANLVGLEGTEVANEYGFPPLYPDLR